MARRGTQYISIYCAHRPTDCILPANLNSFFEPAFLQQNILILILKYIYIYYNGCSLRCAFMFRSNAEGVCASIVNVYIAIYHSLGAVELQYKWVQIIALYSWMYLPAEQAQCQLSLSLVHL